MQCPPDRFYHAEHLWLRREGGDEARIGATDFAQDRLGLVACVQCPQAGTRIEQGVSFGILESAKTASDLVSPASGTVIAVNEMLKDDPALVNRDPYGEGWIVRIRLTAEGEIGGLMNSGQYLQHLGEQA